MSNVDPILVAGDDGEVLAETDDNERATLGEFGIVAADNELGE